MQSTVDLLLFCNLIYLIAAAPFTGSMRSAESASAVNNAGYTGTHTWLEEWSAEGIHDYNVMGYDRKNNMILGYQKSSGKIFSKKQSTAYSAPRPLRLESAFIVKVTDSGCSVLTFDDSIAPGVSWGEPIDNSAINRLAMWSYKGFSGWVADMNRFEIGSNLDASLRCQCKASRLQGLLRGTIAREVKSCEAIKLFRPSSIYELEHGDRSPSQTTVLFCQQLEATLRSAKGFFPVQLGTLTANTRCSHIELLGKTQASGRQAEPEQLDRIPKAPRATGLMQLKHAAQVIDVADSTMAIVSVTLETILQYVRKNMFDIDSLHTHERNSAEIEERRSQAVLEDDLLPVSVKRNCDAQANSYVRSMLETKGVALTPESVNTTRLCYETGSYVLENLQCLLDQMEVSHSLMQCASTALGGTENANSLDLDAALTGVLTAGASTLDASTSLHALRSAISRKHAKEMAASGQDWVALADEVSRLSTEAADTVLRRLSSVSSQYGAMMQAWNTSNVMTTNSSTPTAQHSFQDVWCCAVLPKRPYLLHPKYPPCLPHQIRLIRRELKAN